MVEEWPYDLESDEKPDFMEEEEEEEVEKTPSKYIPDYLGDASVYSRGGDYSSRISCSVPAAVLYALNASSDDRLIFEMKAPGEVLMYVKDKER